MKYTTHLQFASLVFFMEKIGYSFTLTYVYKKVLSYHLT